MTRSCKRCPPIKSASLISTKTISKMACGPSSRRLRAWKETSPAAPPPAATATNEPVDDGSLHSGLFQATVPLVKAEEPIANDQILQALPSDQIRVTYLDENHFKDGVRTVVAKVACLEGNIGGRSSSRGNRDERTR